MSDDDKRYLIETFGCQMNVHDSERMAGLLEQAGYEPAADGADADVIVINTCSVRERAEEKLYTRLGEIRVLTEETGRAPLVAVAGCVAQQEGDALLEDERPPDRRRRRHAGAKRCPCSLDARGPRDDVRRGRYRLRGTTCRFRSGSTRRGDRVKAYVTIIEGCNDHCAFCVVPYTRGHERMRASATSSPTCGRPWRPGGREVQLLGQIVNHYQAPDDPACDFAGLLAAVHEVPGRRADPLRQPAPAAHGRRG